MSERIRLITWLRDVHAIPPRDVESLIEDMEHAAEERERRRGLEERDELLGRARDWLEFMAVHPGEGDAKNLIARIDAALAPRDSGKEG